MTTIETRAEPTHGLECFDAWRCGRGCPHESDDTVATDLHALAAALAAVYPGADLIDASTLADHLDDLGFMVVPIVELEPSDEVFAFARYRNNAELVAAAARLGWLRDNDRVLDPTWGKGTFWKTWRPGILDGTDLDPAKSPTGLSVDFTRLPYPSRSYDAVVFDPPYKLNGTPDPIEERYGVHEVKSRDGRHELMYLGITECARVADDRLLVKVQDQVNGGKVRWQTRMFADHAESLGFELVDRLDLLGGRPQPANRTRKHPACSGQGCDECDAGREPTVQHHARRNSSSLLVFQRTGDTPAPTLLDPT